MASETQIFSREMILSAYKAVRQLSRILYKSTLFMQNKAKVKIGKMNISIAGINDYGKNNEQSTTNVTQNKAKQSQFSNRKTDDRMRADLVCGDFGCTLV
jgi:hypothetical protein